MSWVEQVAGVKQPVLGMLHRLPLPLVPRCDALTGACGGKFVRDILLGAYSSDMGLWNTDVDGVMLYRHQVSPDHVRVLFNINAEFAVPTARRPLEEVTCSVAFSNVPDSICVSGQMTGEPVNASSLETVKRAAGKVSVFINNGARVENICQLLLLADGVIVGSSLKYSGQTWNAVDAERVKAFMTPVREMREDRRRQEHGRTAAWD